MRERTFEVTLISIEKMINDIIDSSCEKQVEEAISTLNATLHQALENLHILEDYFHDLNENSLSMVCHIKTLTTNDKYALAFILRLFIFSNEIKKNRFTSEEIDKITDRLPDGLEICCVTPEFIKQMATKILDLSLANITLRREKSAIISLIMTKIPETLLDIPTKSEICKKSAPDVDLARVQINHIDTPEVKLKKYRELIHIIAETPFENLEEDTKLKKNNAITAFEKMLSKQLQDTQDLQWKSDSINKDIAFIQSLEKNNKESVYQLLVGVIFRDSIQEGTIHEKDIRDITNKIPDETPIRFLQPVLKAVTLRM